MLFPINSGGLVTATVWLSCYFVMTSIVGSWDWSVVVCDGWVHDGHFRNFGSHFVAVVMFDSTAKKTRGVHDWTVFWNLDPPADIVSLQRRTTMTMSAAVLGML